jgi:DNA-binding protein H-NS
MSELDTMSKEDLAKERAAMQARLKAIEKAEAEYDGRRLKELKAEIEKRLAEEGYTLNDLVDGRSATKRSSKDAAKNAPKYRHPENPSLTWSGRGRQPGWYKEALESGKAPEDLLI